MLTLVFLPCQLLVLGRAAVYERCSRHKMLLNGCSNVTQLSGFTFSSPQAFETIPFAILGARNWTPESMD